MEDQVADILGREGGLDESLAKLASSQHLATLKAYLANYDSQVWIAVKASCSGNSDKDFVDANRMTAGIQALEDLIRHCEEALAALSPKRPGRNGE